MKPHTHTHIERVKDHHAITQEEEKDKSDCVMTCIVFPYSTPMSAWVMGVCVYSLFYPHPSTHVYICMMMCYVLSCHVMYIYIYICVCVYVIR